MVEKANGSAQLDVAELDGRSGNGGAAPSNGIQPYGRGFAVPLKASRYDENEEPLLHPNEDRFVMYPVRCGYALLLVFIRDMHFIR
jgi:hypothetical protein